MNEEYDKVAHDYPDMLISEINKKAKEGWTLITVTFDLEGFGYVGWMKRIKE